MLLFCFLETNSNISRYNDWTLASRQAINYGPDFLGLIDKQPRFASLRTSIRRKASVGGGENKFEQKLSPIEVTINLLNWSLGKTFSIS